MRRFRYRKQIPAASYGHRSQDQTRRKLFGPVDRGVEGWSPHGDDACNVLRTFLPKHLNVNSTATINECQNNLWTAIKKTDFTTFDKWRVLYNFAYSIIHSTPYVWTLTNNKLHIFVRKQINVSRWCKSPSKIPEESRKHAGVECNNNFLYNRINWMVHTVYLLNFVEFGLII
jgi:hypothetical protein